MTYALQHEKATVWEKESFAKVVELSGKYIHIKLEDLRSNPEDATSI